MNLQEKFLAITEKAQAIEKKGYNDYSKYSYVRAVDVIAEIQSLLIEFKVAVNIDEVEHIRDSIGKNFHSTLRCKATWTNVENPKETEETHFYTVSADTLDKDIFKAKTNGLKYLFAQKFLIVTDLTVDAEQYAKKNAKKLAKIYGVCNLCDAPLKLGRGGKHMYCTKDNKHDRPPYDGWEALPDDMQESTAIEMRRWFRENRMDKSTDDLPKEVS